MGPHAEHPRELFAQAAPLWQLTASLALRLGAPAPLTLDARYGADGVFELTAESEDGRTVAVLAVGPQAPLPNERGVVALGELGFVRARVESPQNSILAKALALAWAASRGREELAFLRLINRELTVFELDATAMDRLVARRFDPGRSALYGFVFARTEEEPGRRYAFVFTRPQDGTSFRLTLATPQAAVGTPLLGTLAPFCIALQCGPNAAAALRPLSSLDELPDTDTAEAVTALRFLLARALPADLALGAYTPQAAPSADGGESQADGGPLLSSTLDADTIWRRFFVPFEAERELVCNLPSGRDRFGRVLYFMHGEAECTRIQPNQPGCVAFQKPIARPGSEPSAFVSAQTQEPRPEPPSRRTVEETPLQLSVLMSEKDVVYGASSRYAEELAKQRENAKPGDLIVVNETCVARIMSEDLSRIKRAHLAAGGAPIVELDIGQNGPLEMLSHLVGQHKALLLAAGGIEAQGGVIENGVAFVGFQKGPLEEELRVLLEALGLRFEGFFLPLLDRGDLLGALRAKWLVCHPAPIWQAICARHLQGAHTRLITPPLPYGRTATLRFFETIASATGELAHWAEFAERAKSFSADEDVSDATPPELGYVLDWTELERLLAGEGPLHVPALAYLEELGFPQRIFLFAPEGQGTLGALRAALAPHLQKPESVSVTCFASKDELREALCAAETRLVYSQFTFDKRLLSCGKGAFDLTDLEPGYGGARRSYARLRRRAAWEGPRRLGGYLRVPGWSK